MKKLFLTMFAMIALSVRGVTVSNLWSTNELWLASESLASNVAVRVLIAANSATEAAHTVSIAGLEGQTNLINSALQPAGTNGWTVSSHAGYLTAEADTLQSVAARGGFAGTEEIGPLRVTAKMFGFMAGAGATGFQWGAYGHYSGYGSSGNDWGAYGPYAGYEAAWSNSVAVGTYAGMYATGTARMYLDVYAAYPGVTHDPTNNVIFVDNGQLNLGRTGPLTNSADNVLRGNWNASGALNVNTIKASGAVSGINGVESNEFVTVAQWESGLVAADATPYAITAASGTATVARANGMLQSLTMTGPLVLNVEAGSASYSTQFDLDIVAGTNTLTYSVNATNIVTGLSDITVTNTMSILLYSPFGATAYKAGSIEL